MIILSFPREYVYVLAGYVPFIHLLYTSAYVTFVSVDICKLLTQGTYKSARSYWHRLKRTDDYFDLEQGYNAIALTLPCRDGKCYLTDVVDLDGLLYLITNVKHKNGRMFKLYALIKGMAHIKGEIGVMSIAMSRLVFAVIQLSQKVVLFAREVMTRKIVFD